MGNINEIAKDLNIETKAQGEMLLEVNKNVADANENAKDAHKEIE